MKTTFSFVLLIPIGMLGCKPKGPLVEPKDRPLVSTASPASTTLSAQLTVKSLALIDKK